MHAHMQMEVMFASMAEWEQFLAAIPAEEHRAWAQQIQGLVDGSPQWQVFRSAALFQGKQAGGGGAGAVSSAPAAGSSSPLAVATASGPILDVGVEVLKYGPGDGQQVRRVQRGRGASSSCGARGCCAACTEVGRMPHMHWVVQRGGCTRATYSGAGCIGLPAPGC